MVGEVIAGFGAVKTAFDIAKGLKDIDDAARRNAAVIELQEQILSAQQEQLALAGRIRELEAKLAGFETWESEKKRYQLTDYGGGTFAYSVKEGAREGEPFHRICAACYQNRRKSILQATGRNGFKQEVFKCTACDATVALGTRAEQDISGGATWGRRGSP